MPLRRALGGPLWIVLLALSCGSGKAARDGAVGGSGGGGAGGAGDASTCAAVVPCGGDVVGTWQVTQSCLTSTEDLSSACPGASATIEFMFAGTMTFAVNGTYTTSNVGGGTTHYHYPGACIPATYTCMQYGQVLMAIGSYSSVDCTTDAAGFCTCAAVTAPPSSTQTASYSTAGTILTTTTASGMTSSSPYCVEGNLLYLMQASSDGGIQSTGSVILTRQ